MHTPSDLEEEYETSDFDDDSEEFEKDEEEVHERTEDETFVPSDNLDDMTFDKTDSTPTDLAFIETISYTDPEVMLTKLMSINIDSQFTIARAVSIKCLALCKIIYSEKHWKVAEAHVQLANVYLKGKHYSQQVLKHTNIARDILLSGSIGDPSDESKKEYLLQNLYYLLGRVNYQLSKYKISENLLMKAKLVSEHTTNSTSKFLVMKMNILSSLASTLSKLGMCGQATEYLEEAIEIGNRMSGSERHLILNFYKQIVMVEHSNGADANVSFAIESACKALELSLSFNGSNSTATAEMYVLVSRTEMLKDIPDYENIGKNLQNALTIYKKLENKAKMIQIQEMICKLLMKQEKFSNAKSILKEAITLCEDKYSDMSIRSAELYELMGNILFAENKMSNALVYLLKAEEPLKHRNGFQKKAAKISKLIEVIKKSQLKTSNLKQKEKPRFC